MKLTLGVGSPYKSPDVGRWRTAGKAKEPVWLKCRVTGDQMRGHQDQIRFQRAWWTTVMTLAFNGDDLGSH